MSEQNIKICSNCSTPNSADFTYCKNCGTQLYTDFTSCEQEPQAYVPPEHRQNAFYEKDGVDAKTMSIFVGKNSDTYLSKFSAMKIYNRRTSWHWPLFILGALLGPVGMAFWFFYRKMYKMAFLLLAIGTLLVAGELWASYVMPLKTIAQTYGADLFLSESAMTESVLTEIADIFMQSGAVVNLITSAISLAALILIPLLAFGMYEKLAIKRIKRIKQLTDDTELTLYQVKNVGGVSVAAAIIAPIVYYVVSFIVLIVAIVAFALSIMPMVV